MKKLRLPACFCLGGESEFSRISLASRISRALIKTLVPSQPRIRIRTESPPHGSQKVARDGMSVQNFLTDEGSKELHGVRSDELTAGNGAGNRGGARNTGTEDFLLFPAVLKRFFLPGSAWNVLAAGITFQLSPLRAVGGMSGLTWHARTVFSRTRTALYPEEWSLPHPDSGSGEVHTFQWRGHHIPAPTWEGCRVTL